MVEKRDDIEVPDFHDIQEALRWALYEVGLARWRVAQRYLQIKNELEIDEQSALRTFGETVVRDKQVEERDSNG